MATDSDNIYPNNGESFANKETIKAQKKETDDTLSQLPLLKETLNYFQQRIEHYSSVDAIPVDLSQDPETHRNIVAVNQLMKVELQSVAGWIEARITEAVR